MPTRDDETVHSSEEADFATSHRIKLTLAACLLLASVILLGMILWLLRMRQRQLQNEQLERARQRISTNHPMDPARYKRRQETIETWLISKKVQPHDALCERIQAKICSLPPSHEQRECAICLSSFRLKENVSWSPGDSCRHCFHTACLAAWLLPKDQCPCCRQVFLPVDQYIGGEKMLNLQELSQCHFQRSALTYYCVQCGLVELPRGLQCSASEVRQMEGRIWAVGNKQMVSREEPLDNNGSPKMGAQCVDLELAPTGEESDDDDDY